MSVITAPGVYAGIPSETYHSLGLTPEFALSSSGARKIDAECPLSFWWSSPLNPDRETEHKTEFDIGTATHLLVLEPQDFDGRVREIDADNWTTKAAREDRDAAREDGFLPLLSKQVRMVRAMRHAIFSHPIAKHAFEGGTFEQTVVWKDAETGVWLRCRPDFLPDHSRYLTDLKTAVSAHPRDFERALLNHGYHMQASWYLDGFEAVTGEKPKRFFFPTVEKSPPYLVAVHEVDADTIAWGRIQNRRAIRQFAECMASGEWPGYRDPAEPALDQAFKIGLPGFALRDLEKRHERGEFDGNAFERAIAAQSPTIRKEAAE